MQARIHEVSQKENQILPYLSKVTVQERKYIYEKTYERRLNLLWKFYVLRYSRVYEPKILYIIKLIFRYKSPKVLHICQNLKNIASISPPEEPTENMLQRIKMTMYYLLICCPLVLYLCCFLSVLIGYDYIEECPCECSQRQICYKYLGMKCHEIYIYIYI